MRFWEFHWYIQSET